MNSNITRNLLTTVSILFCATLAGCALQKPKTNVVPTEQKYVSPPTQRELTVQTSTDPETRRLQQCQQELEALKTIAPATYTVQKHEFDRIMSGAAQYAGIRQDVNGDTQGAVDALYHYKAARLCATIGQAVLDSLSNRGELSK
ncbi:hypothetical protein [Rouxiella sp. Mn2063]|uniref:hypothetical protein n=1 Tax=Rouxiella sp. Mn2063 TaxID=3395262 RepID=UPI003BDCFCB6